MGSQRDNKAEEKDYHKEQQEIIAGVVRKTRNNKTL
jgi:hypothetical protein